MSETPTTPCDEVLEQQCKKISRIENTLEQKPDENHYLEDINTSNSFLREKQTSEIVINRQKAGFSLTTDNKGHWISAVDQLLFPDLNIREADRLICIESMDVQCWDHEVIVYFLGHIFKPHSKSLEMILLRNNSFILREIAVEEMDNDLNGIAVSIKSFVFSGVSRPMSFKKVTLVRKGEERVCMICHTTKRGDQLYIQVNKGKLSLGHVGEHDKTPFYFRIFGYRGVQKRSDHKEEVEFYLFTSVSSGKCLTIKGLRKLGLMAHPRPANLTHLTKADPRYFTWRRTSHDRTKEIIESLVCPELYIAVDTDKKKLYLTRDDSKDDTRIKIEYVP